MRSYTLIFTCHNRIDKTRACLASLIGQSKARIILVDDGSTDGTAEMVQNYADEHGCESTIIRGDGSLYYCGGMRLGIAEAKRDFQDEIRNTSGKSETDDVSEREKKADVSKAAESDSNLRIPTDFYVLMNDDVRFNMSLEEIDALVDTDAIYVGCTQDSEGRLSYGVIDYYKGIRYTMSGPGERKKALIAGAARGKSEGAVQSKNAGNNTNLRRTFNANFVCVPRDIFKALPNMDSAYIHSLGDFDYGLTACRLVYDIKPISEYVGVCDGNASTGTWRDTSLSRVQRLRAKEDIKGAPFGPWFHFLHKNFGLPRAIISSITPYVRILVGK